MIGISTQIFGIGDIFAQPHLARQHQTSCITCHSAVPALNRIGQHYKNNPRVIETQASSLLESTDPVLQLPREFPISLYAQSTLKAQRGANLDPSTGASAIASPADIQAPNILKLLSSAPIGDNADFTLNARLDSSQGNSSFYIEKAVARYRQKLDDVVLNFNIGQYDLSEILIDSKTRLSAQEYTPYRLSGIGLDRGLRLDAEIEDTPITIGINNGNDLDDLTSLNSSGLGRTGQSYDNNAGKSFFVLSKKYYKSFEVGALWLVSEQKAVSGALGTTLTSRDTDRTVVGAHVSSFHNGKNRWYAQVLWNQWVGFIEQTKRYHWLSGFAGYDYFASDKYAFSLLYNYADAGDLKGTGTVFEGLNMNIVSATASYYFSRNMRVLFELSMDFLPADDDSDFVGHESKEDSALIAIDISY